ncbi:MAG TPA: TIGR01777 family oxidoreductase [Solirubrobacteraceae bacterium]|nr:TIGR01777 family oxidoreductase [Solirubrobacteraceae bacterium]
MAERSVTLSGATGLIGTRLVGELLAAGWDVTVLSRDPDRARARLGDRVRAERWDLLSEPAPAGSLAGRDAVVSLAGEPVSQRWSAAAKRAIRDSRVTGTENLIAGLRAAEDRPGALVSASATGYYGPRGAEPVDEEAPPGEDFLAEVCVAWERATQPAAAELGMRVVQIRTGVVLDGDGGALEKMLPPFKLGVGGPIGGGRQFLPWIHAEDVVGIYLAALGDERWSGPANASAPAPADNREFSHALGRVLHRPAVLPVPGFALRALYGEMAQIITSGARVVPAKPLMLGYSFRHPELEEALRSALGR